MKSAKILWLCVLVILWCSRSVWFIGSDTAVTREARADFVGTSGNTLYGFSSFANGFTLQDATTTCTYDNFFPVAGDVNLHNGTLFLSQDLTLANPHRLITPGLVWGDYHTLAITSADDIYSIPEKLFLHSGFTQKAEANLGAVIYSVGMSINNDYVVGVTAARTGNELNLLYFDGATLTTTNVTDGGTTGELGRATYSCAWHPSDYYLAVTRDAGTGNEIYLYYKNPQGPFRLITSIGFASDVVACVWHPSGDYLVVGTISGTSELIVYPFNKTTGVLGTGVVTNILNSRRVRNNALSFSADGLYLAIGLNTGAGDDLVIYSFSGGVLSNPIGVDLVQSAASVAYNPIFPYVAVGSNDGSQKLRVYYHDTNIGALIPVILTSETKNVNSLAWDNTGLFLAVGLASGALEEVRVYYFDPEKFELTIVYNNAAGLNNINSIGWSFDNQYLITGASNSLLTVYKSDGLPGPLRLKNTALHCGSSTQFLTDVRCLGRSKIAGKETSVVLGDGVRFIVDEGAQLTLENLVLHGLKSSCFSCLGPHGSIILRNSMLCLDHDVTFTQGSLLFEGDVMMTGTNRFVYASAQTSTIARRACLAFMPQTSLVIGNQCGKQPFYCEDEDAILYLNNSTLMHENDGVLFDRGTIMLDNSVTLSNSALLPDQGLTFSDRINIVIANAAVVHTHGIVQVF